MRAQIIVVLSLFCFGACASTDRVAIETEPQPRTEKLHCCEPAVGDSLVFVSDTTMVLCWELCQEDVPNLCGVGFDDGRLVTGFVRVDPADLPRSYESPMFVSCGWGPLDTISRGGVDRCWILGVEDSLQAKRSSLDTLRIPVRQRFREKADSVVAYYRLDKDPLRYWEYVPLRIRFGYYYCYSDSEGDESISQYLPNFAGLKPLYRSRDVCLRYIVSIRSIEAVLVEEYLAIRSSE